MSKSNSNKLSLLSSEHNFTELRMKGLSSQQLSNRKVATKQIPNSQIRLTEVSILNSSECRAVVVRIDSISDLWYRYPDQVFFTFGSPLYRNKNSYPLYRTRADTDNILILQHFDELFFKVLAALQQYFSEPLHFYSDCAVPGFHVIDARRTGFYAGGGGHYDISYKLKKWNEEVDDGSNYSFTVPLELPNAGSGIDIWEFTEPLKDNDARFKRTELDTSANKFHFSYVLGNMIIFRGDYYHQIAPIKFSSNDTRRITLQGHCIRVGSRLVIYW
jgi:hypothetical protein